MEDIRPLAHISSAIDYTPTKMRNMKSWKKSVRFTPQSYSGNINYNEIIRFIINTDGYWDPYNTYILMEVDTSESDNATVQQLDGSAHSFISEMIITSGGNEIERVLEYDVLGNILNDVNFSKEERDEKAHEGLGSWQNGQQTQDAERVQADKLIYQGATFAGNYWKTNLKNRPYIDFWKTPQGIAQGGKEVSGGMNITGNPALDVLQQESLSITKQLELLGGTGLVYSVPILDRVDQQMAKEIKYTPQNFAKDNESFSFGVSNFNNNFFTASSYEPTFSNTMQRDVITNGKMAQIQIINNQTFVVPLLSSIFGILLPAENYKYIPMKYLKDLQLEFRLNPYAMFTSGYSNEQNAGTIISGDTFTDCTKYAWNQSPTVQQIRKWKFKKFEIWTDVVYFPPEVDAVVDQQFQETGLTINTRGYSLGPLYQIAGTAQASASWQVNLGFESLQGVLVHYLLNDYQTYSFCRKNFRVSSNITKLQCKFGVDYIPPLPIEGHGGQQFGTQSNSKTAINFILHLQKLFGKLHDVQNHGTLNLYNFPVNERLYDVTKTGPLVLFTNANPAATKFQLNNYQTACGLPSIYENQLVGKAMYGVNLQQLNHNVDSLAGINTTGVRPFEIIIETDSSNVDPVKDRKRTMYIWCIHDYTIVIGRDGVITYGRS